jgi:hypothetical protein
MVGDGGDLVDEDRRSWLIVDGCSLPREVVLKLRKALRMMLRFCIGTGISEKAAELAPTKDARLDGVAL